MSLSVSPFLNEDVQGIAILIDSSPQILASALNRDENLIEESHVAKFSLSSLHRSGEVAPKINGLNAAITIPKKTRKILILLGVFWALFLGMSSAAY